MPLIGLDLADQYYLFENGPKDYMMLPFIQYFNNDSSQCMLAIANSADFDQSTEVSNPITVGQRFLATTPLLLVVDRQANQIQLSLGNGQQFSHKSQISWITLITTSSVIVLSSMIVWLDHRRKSWQANDDWLQRHKREIMSEIKLQDRFL